MKLFWKIFLSFWLTMILIVALTGWINFRVLRDAGLGDLTAGVQQRLLMIAERTANRLQRGHLPTSPRHERGPGARMVRIFDANGDQVFGRPLPPRHANLTKFEERREGRGYVVIPVDAPNGQRFQVVAAAQLPPRLLFAGGRGLLVRLAVAALISALVCWWLTRFLTRPIKRLSAASQQLAAGELGARVETKARYANDEIGELGRDFDRMAEGLQRYQQLQRQLLRDVSHELRSPLARLQLAVGIARKKADVRLESDLDRIASEADRLDDLIEEILTYTRGAAAQEPIELTEVDLAELLAIIVDDANFEAEQSEQQVHFSSSADRASAHIDSRLFCRAVENTIRNAVHHGATGSLVSVTLTVTGNQAQVDVHDSGPGVPADELQRIFEPFHQTNPARSSGKRGFGLGLAIAKQSIERLQGSITAKNRPEGGLLVTVSLPLRPAPMTSGGRAIGEN